MPFFKSSCRKELFGLTVARLPSAEETTIPLYGSPDLSASRTACLSASSATNSFKSFSLNTTEESAFLPVPLQTTQTFVETSFSSVNGITDVAARELETENEELIVNNTGYKTTITFITSMIFKIILSGVARLTNFFIITILPL